METKTIIEISGYLVAIFLAIIGIIKAKENWKDKAAVINVSLSLVILTIIISVRYQVIPKIEDNQLLAKKINENNDAYILAEKYVDAKYIADNSEKELFVNSLNNYYKQFLDNLDLAKKGQFIVSKEDLGAFSYRLIEKTERSIIASSYVNSKEFWDNQSGKKYEALNYSLAKNGKIITRYFIFSNEAEYKNGIERIKEQTRNKIDVYIAFVDQLERKETDDIILVDDLIGGRLKLTPDKGISHAIIYTQKGDLDDIYGIIENLKAKAFKYEENKY